MLKQQQKMLRHESIISSLDNLSFANRRQLQLINDLGGDRNANRILSEMEKDKSIKSIRTEQKIYYVANRGKEKVGSNKQTKDKGQIIHTLMRNDMYIYLGMPKDWSPEQAIDFEIDGEMNTLISDAVFTQKGEYHFLEVDNSQTMRTNKDKIDKYKALSMMIWENDNHTPTLIWYTVSQNRKIVLKEYCEKKAVKAKVYCVGEV